MKYHKHIVKKVPCDLGEDDPKLNYVYEIWKDGKKITEAITLSSAKEYIDSGYNEYYLGG